VALFPVVIDSATASKCGLRSAPVQRRSCQGSA